jgi:hypothetical protein
MSTSATDHVTVDPRTLTAWTALSDSEQAHILETLAELAAQPPERWPTDLVQHLATSEPLYLLHGRNDVQVIFRKTADGITLLDLVLWETIERYFVAKKF